MGKNEVPKVNSTAKGTANFKSKKDILIWKINVTGLTNATGAQLYLGNKSVKGDIIVNLMKSGNRSQIPLGLLMNGNISASDLQGPMQGKTIKDLKSIMNNSQTYVNILTGDHPDGERGTVKISLPKNQTSMRLLTRNFFLSIKAIADVPIKVADQYNQRSPTEPDNSAGARDLAGFIEAPEMSAKKNMSRPTIPPIAIPLKPRSPFIWTTANITAIKSADANTSIPKITGSG